MTVPAAGKVCAVRLGRAVYINSRPDLADLRVAYADQEVAYLLDVMADQWVVAELTPARSEDARTNTTTLLFDLGTQGLPHDRIRLETTAPYFYRAVEIDSSRDGSRWKQIASGFLYRLPRERSLTLSYPEQHNRYLRLRIANRNDRPVPFGKASFLALERQIEFLPQAGQYWIYYGNPEAPAPVYDLPVILQHQRNRVEVLLAAGAQEMNPAYQAPTAPPKPWTERNPALLHAILAAAILALGYITVRFLLLAKKQEEGPGH
ncbi:MAG: DUF3999 domain-containing protein [Acidobacteria bacterium]|nr:DUF3999 domain-containing protein [Acidobacteriota bacterium]